MNVNEWLEKAHELRATMYEDESRFYLFLVDGEAGGVPWRGTTSSFEELLDDAKLCNVARYVNLRNALKVISREQVARIGVDGAIDAAAVQDSTKRKHVLISLDEARERIGHPMSARDVKRVIQQIAPVERTTKDLIRGLNRSKLEQENESLRRRVKQLERENAKLETQIAKMAKQKKTG